MRASFFGMGTEALFYPCFAEGDYEKASHYLNYYSAEDPERKRKEAMIKSKTGKREEAHARLMKTSGAFSFAITRR